MTDRTSTEIMTRSGGIFWGAVLLIVGLIWLVASLGYVDVNLNVVLPLLLLLAGLWLLITKTMR